MAGEWCQLIRQLFRWLGRLCKPVKPDFAVALLRTLFQRNAARFQLRQDAAAFGAGDCQRTQFAALNVAQRRGQVAKNTGTCPPITSFKAGPPQPHQSGHWHRACFRQSRFDPVPRSSAARPSGPCHRHCCPAGRRQPAKWVWMATSWRFFIHGLFSKNG